MKITLKDSDKTETGLAKMDVDTLQKYKIPIVQNVLEWRKWKKVNDTYLKSCAREATDNKIHTSLRLEGVQTFRSSASDPNLQNIPARDLDIMNTIRKCFIASKGNILKEFDYKAMEASIVSCYNKDPNWTRYVSDPKNDMHRDIGSKLFMKEIKDISKDERFFTKNDFVFATIYGSYWKNTATSLWNDISKETKAWLASKNIKTLNKFKDHVHDVEDWFWHDQFPVGFAWMEKTLSDFEQKNYIDLYTGFRCYGPMSRNQVINYRVQGTASHCKLWTLKNVNKALTKNKMKSKIILEIHDSIIVDTVPEEEKEVDNLIWKYGTQ
jgi:DNA polymerase-1